MITLVEFIHPLRRGKQRDAVLGVLYFCKRYKDRPEMTASEIKTALQQARVPGARDWNVNAVVNNAAPYVQQEGSTEKGALLFGLTGTGADYVRDMLDLPTAEPEVEHDVGALTKLAASVTDDDVRGYIEEGIRCLQVGALRAAVVFVWTGAVATIRDELMSYGAQQVDAAIKKHDSRARNLTRQEDFENVKDSILLEAAHTLGAFDKSEKKRLKEALDLRNDCGHPVKYTPGEKKVSSFIEDVVGIVFT